MLVTNTAVLQHMFDMFFHCCNKGKFKLSITKTKALIFNENNRDNKLETLLFKMSRNTKINTKI